MPDEWDELPTAVEHQDILLALLSSAARERRCSGRVADVRMMLDDASSLGKERREHILDCASCALILVAEQGCREAGKAAVERSLRNTFAALNLPKAVPDPMADSGALHAHLLSARAPSSTFVECALANPPFSPASGESRLWDELAPLLTKHAVDSLRRENRTVLHAPSGLGRARLVDSLFRKLGGGRWLWVAESEPQARAYASRVQTPVETASLETLPKNNCVFDLILLDAPFPASRRMDLLAKHSGRQVALSASTLPMLRTWELAPLPRWESVDTGCHVRVRPGKSSVDLSPSSLSSLDNKDRNRLIALRLLHDRPRKAIVFTAGKDHSTALRQELQRRSPDIGTALVDDTTSYEDRAQVGRDLASSAISIVFDSDPRLDAPSAPDLETIYIARPTLQPDVYARMCWRALPALAQTRRVTVVDFRDRFMGLRRPAVDGIQVGLPATQG